jgi:hypothetical protein
VCRELGGHQAHTADPALAALVQRGHARTRERDADALEHLARLTHGEAQIRGPQLGQRVGETQSMQAESQRGPRQQHDAQLRRQSSQEALELRLALGRLQLVQIVDDERAGLLAASHTRELVGHRAPEPPLVALSGPHRRPAGVLSEPGISDPGAQQAGLPARGRRRDHRYRAGCGQPIEQPAPVNDRRVGARHVAVHEPERAGCGSDQRHDRRAIFDGRFRSRAGQWLAEIAYGDWECAHAVPFVAERGSNDDYTVRAPRTYH